MASNRGFHWKVFISFGLMFVFLAIALSGAVLYVAPPGRIANWSIWSLAGLSKAEWQAVHTVFATLFIALAVLHVVFNWKVVVAYLRMRMASGGHRVRELATAGALAAAVFGATLGGLPPFATLMRAGEMAKNGWVSPRAEPPVPHAEILTIARLADTLRVPADRIVANLKAVSIDATTDSTLADLAAARRSTPAAIYALATSGVQRPRGRMAEGGGYGWKTIDQLCEQLAVPVDVALARLAADGVTAKSTDVVREVAAVGGRPPLAIVKLIADERP